MSRYADVSMTGIDRDLASAGAAFESVADRLMKGETVAHETVQSSALMSLAWSTLAIAKLLRRREDE